MDPISGSYVIWNNIVNIAYLEVVIRVTKVVLSYHVKNNKDRGLSCFGIIRDGKLVEESIRNRKRI
jgi:hypothetical protein